MQRKKIVAISAIAFLALSVGTAIAYFSHTKRVPLGQFETGSTEIVVTGGTIDAENILPGGTHMFTYSIENTGSVPVQVRSKLEPSWSNPQLSTQMVHGVELVVNRGSGYQTIYSHPFGVDTDFYFSNSGTDDALWQLAPGQIWNVQVTVKLHDQAGPEYMNANYFADVIVGVREVGIQVPWPQFE